jgi:hypothetical protein
VHAAGQYEAEGDGRVEMTAGDRTQRTDHHGDRDTVRQRDPEQGSVAARTDHQVGTDRQDANERQREGTDRLGDQNPNAIIAHVFLPGDCGLRKRQGAASAG